MITQETCAAIYAAHREILAGEQLLADMKEQRERMQADKHARPCATPSVGFASCNSAFRPARAHTGCLT